jgi:hypothetical protein
MMQAVLAAAGRLAEALRAENEALARLDLGAAAELGRAKRQAAEAFETTFAAAARSGTTADAALRARAEEAAQGLRALTTENRRLLERAIDLQSRVIEAIAGAARPPGPGTYSALGRTRPGRSGPVSVASRA